MSRINNAATGRKRGKITIVARIERQLAVQIMRGERAPGSRLPPVREMAQIFGVTVPTIQRVVERLEATGLVRARRGSGIMVNDPRLSADLSLLPVWFDALADQPERAAEILSDFLELRRVLLAHFLRTGQVRVSAAASQLGAIAQRLVNAASMEEIVEADLEATRAVLESVNNFAALTLFRAVEDLTSRVPVVAEALYGDRAYHQQVLVRLATIWLSGAEPFALAEQVENVLSQWDRRTAKRLRAMLSETVSADTQA